MKQDLTLVIGSSGTVGSEIVRLLRAEGHQVRTTTSKPTQDPQAVQINLATGEGFKTAFSGVDKAFLLSPPGHADHYAMLSPLIQEAKRRGLKKVVLMTAMGANADATSPFRRAEIELEKSGLNYNIIRPNWFLQNFNTFWLAGILAQNKILLPAGTAKVGFIDARDIAAVAAKLLTSHDRDGRDFDLTGPESLDHAQVANALTEVTGRKITYEEIAPEVLENGLVAGGVPKDYAAFMILIFGFLRAGYNASVNANVKTILGRDPIGVMQYARDHRQVWLRK